MIRTVAIGAMIGAISALAGSAISGEVTVTIFFLCLLAFMAVEATTRFIEIKLHKRFMEVAAIAEANLEAGRLESNPRFTIALSTMHGGWIQ